MSDPPVCLFIPTLAPLSIISHSTVRILQLQLLFLCGPLRGQWAAVVQGPRSMTWQGNTAVRLGVPLQQEKNSSKTLNTGHGQSAGHKVPVFSTSFVSNTVTRLQYNSNQAHLETSPTFVSRCPVVQARHGFPQADIRRWCAVAVGRDRVDLAGPWFQRAREWFTLSPQDEAVR